MKTISYKQEMGPPKRLLWPGGGALRVLLSFRKAVEKYFI